MNADLRLFRLVVRSLAALSAAVVLIWLAVKALAPGGVLSVTADFIQPTPFVSEPMPSARLLFPGNGAAGNRAEIIGEPVYVDFTPPPGFDSVDVAFRYRDGIQPDIRIGALVSGLDQSFDVRPAGNALLDGLPWSRIASGRYSLWSKNRKYASFDAYLNDPPPRSQTAAVGRVPLPPFRLPGYAPSAVARTVTRSLRGPQRFLAYIKGEKLNFSFSIQDMNRESGADPVVVAVYPADAAAVSGPVPPLASAVLPDDGDVADDQKQSGLRTVTVSASGLAEGVYAVEFGADQDIFIRSFTTTQRKAVLEGRAYLGDHVGYSDQSAGTTVWVGGRRITVRTDHPEGLQNLTVAGAPLVITELHLKAAVSLPSAAPAAVRTPAGDVLLETDGVIALTKDDYFDPLPFVPDWTTTADDLERRGIVAAVADYEAPETAGDDRIARTSFDLHSLARTEDGAYRFVLSAPGIDLSGRSLPVTSVSFTLRRRPVSWSKAWSRLLSGGNVGPAAGTRAPGAVSFGENPR